MTACFVPSIHPKSTGEALQPLTAITTARPCLHGGFHRFAATGMVETQRHSPRVAKEASSAKSVAKEAAPAKDVSPVIATAKADTKKIKHYKSQAVARQRNNYGYGNALGYAEESGHRPRGPFFR